MWLEFTQGVKYLAVPFQQKAFLTQPGIEPATSDLRDCNTDHDAITTHVNKCGGSIKSLSVTTIHHPIIQLLFLWEWFHPPSPHQQDSRTPELHRSKQRLCGYRGSVLPISTENYGLGQRRWLSSRSLRTKLNTAPVHAEGRGLKATKPDYLQNANIRFNSK